MASSRVSGVRLDHILHQSREPVFWLNADLRLLWVNRAWEKFTGYSAEAVAGLVCRAHGPTRAGDLPDLGGSFFPPVEVLAGRPSSTRTLIVHPNGERRWRTVEYLPFHNEKDELVAILGLLRDPKQPSLSPDAESQRLRIELMEIRDRALTRFGLELLVGKGAAHKRLLDQVGAAAISDVPVLILGESGTGKRHVARMIHQMGSHRQSPFIPFDCAALPPDVLDRELFGPGSEDRTVAPKIALPEGSTLVLGDILGFPRDLQARLAASLDSQIRLIATSTVDPDEAYRSELLRPDFYYAITTLMIRIRPLRDRLDELPLLAQHFLERCNRRGGRQRSGFEADALTTLQAYDWPGNLRELSRVIDDAHGRGEADLIKSPDLPAAIRGNLAAAYLPPPIPVSVTPLDDLLTEVERRLIENALNRARFNKSRAADLLGISRPRLYRRIKELNIADPDDTNVEVPATSEGRL